jgi:hypothetical protein
VVLGLTHFLLNVGSRGDERRSGDGHLLCLGECLFGSDSGRLVCCELGEELLLLLRGESLE